MISLRGRLPFILAGVVACAIIAVIVAALLHSTSGVRNDPAVKEAITTRFQGEPWVGDLVAARWGPDPADLHVSVNSSMSSDSTVIIDMCNKVTVLVAERTDAKGSLFIEDQSGNIIATNFLDSANKCYWRGG